MDSQIRYDAISDKWVLVVPKRKKWTVEQNKLKITAIDKSIKISLNKCTFENPQKFDHKKPIFLYPENSSDKNWKIQIFENKYPVLIGGGNYCVKSISNGNFDHAIEGIGYHDLLVTRDHFKNYSELEDGISFQVLKMISKRISDVSKNKCIKYVHVFQNYGAFAGASMEHPHFQMVSLPIIPSSIYKTLNISKKYKRKHRKCNQCDNIKFEINDKKRIVYKDKDIIAFVPFASGEPFEVRITTLKHVASFEDLNDDLLMKIALVLKKIMKASKKSVGVLEYNFFIRTAPVFSTKGGSATGGDKKSYKHFHWYLEFVPKTNVSAGFEIGTDIEVNPLLPEESARILRTNI
jgi:UDPglucose--hexose-1-phosphate uridylyltransferase